ncbi:hypothetical protein B0T26DRAFT_603189, partial [Lasiosphaeria miniovina]
IYDPMCYPFTDPRPRDIVVDAENDFTVEAAAYAYLDPHIGGKFIPKYYGSFVFSMPIPQQQGLPSQPAGSRQVFAVAIEFVEGDPLSHLKSADYSEAQRMRVMGKAVKGYTMIRHHQVRHNDLAPRNIMTSTKDFNSEKLRISFLDLDAAEVLPLLKGTLPPKPPKPESPIKLFWDDIPSEMQEMGWVSLEWTEEKWNAWLVRTFLGDKEF